MIKFNVIEYLKNQLNKIPPYYNLKFLIFNLKICGSWPPADKYKYIYFIWSLLTLSLTLGHFILVQAVFVVSKWDASERMAAALALLINNHVHLFKVCVVLCNRKGIQSLLNYIDEDKFTCKDVKTAKKLQYKFSHIPFMHYARFQFIGLFACSGWTISAIVHSSKENNERVLPSSSSYPYDAFTSPLYEITFVVQTIAVFNLCIHNISLDGLIISFMAVVGCEFEILNTRIKEIGDNHYNDQNSATNDSEKKYIDDKIYKELTNCVEHHLAIIEYAKKFENIFHSAIFLQFFENSVVICITAFGLSQLTEYNLPTIFSQILYLAAIVDQLFLYCYFGNIVSVQVLNVVVRKNRIKKLLELVKSEQFSSHNENYKTVINSYTLKGILHHIIYQSFGAVAVFCWGFTPIGDLLAGRSRRLPIEGWYPFNTTNTPAFEFTCIHQAFGVMIACFHNVAEDTLVTGLLIVASCQLEILKLNLSKIANDHSSNSNNNYENELKHCVEHHNAIIDFTKEIEAIFGTTIVIQFTVNCIIICLNAFHITKMKFFIPAELIGLTMYTCCMTCQIFIYCWHGNEIVLQSQSVALAAYSGNWWRYNESYKRGLRLLMLRSNRPVTLKAGNFLTLSLQTFVTILRASYSFFTVLQSSTNK